MEKRSADENLKKAKEREIKKREGNYKEKKEQMMREAKLLKRPDVLSPTNGRINPIEIDFREVPIPEGNIRNTYDQPNRPEDNKYSVNDEVRRVKDKEEAKRMQDRERGRQPMNYTSDVNQLTPI